MKNVGCIIARTNSKRLEKKVLKQINNTTMIEYIIENFKTSKKIDQLYLCTSFEESDSQLIEIAKKRGINYFAGDPKSVVGRMLEVAEIEQADNLIRITGDNIFCDRPFTDIMLNYHEKKNADYTRTEFLPIGVTSEIISVKALKKFFGSIDPNFSEYMMLYMFQPIYYNCQVILPNIAMQFPNWSLTVDTAADWERTIAIQGKRTNILNFKEIIQIVADEKIPNLIFSNTENIKFPADVLVSYESFRGEMNYRINQSNQTKLLQGEYESAI